MDITEQLKRDERLRLKPYNDSEGKLTVGYGRNLEDDGISPSEADYLLNNDILAVTSEIQQHIQWARFLDSVRFGVLVNMAFNMGIGSTTTGKGLLGFKNTLAAIQKGDYAGAAVHMLDSKWAIQVKDRAVRLAQQMKTGQWV